MTYLLDVNLLVALTWREHVLHAPAARWFSGLDLDAGQDWATTPVTEAGLVRTSMNARISDHAVSWATALRMIEALHAVPGHRRWPDDVDLASSVLARRAPVVGYRQVTDVHLAALAEHHDGRLATLDVAVSQALHPADRGVVVHVPVDS